MTSLRIFRTVSAIALLAVVLAACGGAPAGSAVPDATETISVSGAFALLPMVSLWADEYQKLNPNVRFDIQGGGAGKGMTDVLSGAVDVAMLSRGVREEETAQGAVLVPVVIDAVVGTVNAENPNLDAILAKGITPELVNGIWITKSVTTYEQWLGNGSSDAINVYTRSDAAGAAEMWARFGGGKAQEELQGIAVNADPGLAEAVRQDKLGVGYNNIGFAYDITTGAPVAGLRVIPLDLNGNGAIDADEDFYATKSDLVDAISRRAFPFPPARELYLVTKGEASPAIKEFYRWILTDGQQFVPAAGYVPLTPEQLEAALASVN
jgi:phosphate transport system substrate-binding protein